MRWSLILLACLTAACGSPSPTAPTPSPVPRPTPTPAPVVTNFAGTWAGTYAVTACDQAGAIRDADWCGLLRAVPSPGLTLQITQTDSTVSAVLALGLDQGTVTGAVTEDQHLTLGGTYASARQGAITTTIVGAWDTRLSDPTHLVGRFAVSQSVAGYSGNMYFEATLATVTR